MRACSLDFMCKQMVTMNHGDLDRRLSTAIDYLFRELVFQKRAGNTKVRGFQLTKYLPYRANIERN